MWGANDIISILPSKPLKTRKEEEEETIQTQRRQSITLQEWGEEIPVNATDPYPTVLTTISRIANNTALLQQM